MRTGVDLRYWNRPDYWRWWWWNRAPSEVRAAIVLLTVALIMTAGYELPRLLPPTPSTRVVTYTYVRTVPAPPAGATTVTVRHTVTKTQRVREPVRVVRRITLPAVTRLTTHTVVVPAAPLTVTQVQSTTVSATTTVPITTTVRSVSAETSTVRVTVRVPVTVTRRVPVTVTRRIPLTVTRTTSQITTVITTVIKTVTAP